MSYQKPLLISGISFFLFLITLSPGLPPVDAGELIGSAVTLGIPHPTGYPLYLLVSRIITMIPASPLVLLSILSALALSIAVFFLAKTIEQEKLHKFSFLFALFFPLSPWVWESAIRPEVYAVYGALIAAVFWAALRVWNQKERAEIWFAFLSGGAVIAHLSSVYFLLPLWIGLLLRKEVRKKLLRPILLPIAILPLTLHLILVIRETFGQPPYSWGDYETLDGWWRHVSGWQYRVWFFESSQAWWKNFSNFFLSLPKNLSYIGFLLFLYGVYHSFKQSKSQTIWLLSAALFSIFMISGYNIPDLDSYYIPSILIFVWFIVFGGTALFRFFRNDFWIPVVLSVIFVSLAILFVPDEGRKLDKRQLTYTKALIQQLPSPCLLITANWPNVAGPLNGLQAMGERRDIVLVDQELMRRSWYIRLLMRKYPHAIKGCEKEFQELIPALLKYERKEPIHASELERKYRAAIHALIAVNIPRTAVCITEEIQTPTSIGNRQLYRIPLLLFSRLLFTEINYNAVPDGLRIDELYDEPIDNVFDKQLREAAAYSFALRANYLFKKPDYREEAFTLLKMARKLQSPQGGHADVLIQLIEREQGRKF